MKWVQRFLSAAAGSAAMVFMTGSGMASAADLPPESFAGLAAEVTPAVVAISTSHRVAAMSVDKPFDQGPEQQKSKGNQYVAALGSGFIIDPSGYVVTNNHVIENAREIQITLHGGKNFSARLIGADDKTDLALLKVDASGPLPCVSFGNSDAARVGDPVLAVGNPFGLGGTVTVGIISAVGRDLHSGSFDDFLQIDASINPGNSGGPSFNLLGEVIGINSAIATPNGGSVGIGFAIPANIAKPVIQQLRLHGRVDRGWIGIRVQEVTPEIAESLDLGTQSGALVTSIQPGGPAAVAGLQQGDVVLSFDGHQVGEARELPRIVAGETAGKRVAVVVWRNGSRKTMSVEMAYPKDKPRTASGGTDGRPIAGSLESLLHGVQITSLTDDLRRKLALPNDVQGVVILDLDERSLAAREGLQRDDVIEQVERHYVSSPGEVDRLIQQAAAKDRSAVLILVRRGGSELYLAVKAAKAGKYLGDPLLYHPAARSA